LKKWGAPPKIWGIYSPPAQSFKNLAPLFLKKGWFFKGGFKGVLSPLSKGSNPRVFGIF